MKKDYGLIVPVFIYELFRCLSIFITRPEDFIDILPLSWYTGIFSLILPCIIVFAAFRKEEKTWNWCYVFVKAGQDIGIAKYIYDDFYYILSEARYDSLGRLVSLVSFLVIDVILIVVLFIYQKKRKDINADNSSCEW